MSETETITQPEMTEEEAFEVRRRYWESVAAIMRANVDAYLMSPLSSSLSSPSSLIQDERVCSVQPDFPGSGYLH